MEKFETISEDMLETVSGGGRGGKGHGHGGIISGALDLVGDVVGGALRGLGGLLSGLGGLFGGRGRHC
ncbi:MAG TPA: bacteriocin [Polyangiales bacterium]|nr:bacteriocin [Polyangiales bacterium]